jgi:hypothetical protein
MSDAIATFLFCVQKVKFKLCMLWAMNTQTEGKQTGDLAAVTTTAHSGIATMSSEEIS